MIKDLYYCNKSILGVFMKARDVGKYLIIIGTILMFVISIVFVLNEFEIGGVALILDRLL